MIDLEKEREAFVSYIKQIYPFAESCAKDAGKTIEELYASEWQIWQQLEISKILDEINQLKEKLAKVNDVVEDLLKNDPILALGELLPLQHEIKLMIEASEVSE